MKRLLTAISMVVASMGWSSSANAACVDCWSFDTCGAAAGFGYLRCKFQVGACVATGLCSASYSSPPPYGFDRNNMMRTSFRDLYDVDVCKSVAPTLTADPALRRVAASTGDAKLVLAADAGTLIQLAQVSPAAAHVAWAIARGAWEPGELTSASVRLRAYAPAQVMQLVSGEEVRGEAPNASLSAISLSWSGTPSGSIALRVYARGVVDTVLDYRPVGSGFRLTSWQ